MLLIEVHSVSRFEVVHVAEVLSWTCSVPNTVVDSRVVDSRLVYSTIVVSWVVDCTAVDRRVVTGRQ